MRVVALHITHPFLYLSISCCSIVVRSANVQEASPLDKLTPYAGKNAGKEGGRRKATSIKRWL